MLRLDNDMALGAADGTKDGLKLGFNKGARDSMGASKKVTNGSPEGDREDALLG
jgi:hypothetical protein